MQRRTFIKNTSLATAALGTMGLELPKIKKKRLTAAYYLRAGMFTQRPKGLESDLDLMKDWDTDILCISMHYMQILRAGVNVERIIREAKNREMEVYVIPARLAGLTAASPIVSFFTVNYPEALSLKKDGSPNMRKNQGAIGSFYHPTTKQYVLENALKLVTDWDFDGLVWDEPKCTWKGWQDFSPLAKESNPTGDFRIYMKDMAAFFSEINARLKKSRPDLKIVHFDEALRQQEVVDESAKIEGLDYFGCDGKPWPQAYPRDGKGTPKSLLNLGTRYLEAAQRQRVGSFFLVENFNLDKMRMKLMEQFLPQVINKNVDMLGYYFYGSGLEFPDQAMDITFKNLKEFKKN